MREIPMTAFAAPAHESGPFQISDQLTYLARHFSIKLVSQFAGVEPALRVNATCLPPSAGIGMMFAACSGEAATVDAGEHLAAKFDPFGEFDVSVGLRHGFGRFLCQNCVRNNIYLVFNRKIGAHSRT